MNPKLSKKDKAVLGSIGLLQLGLAALKIGGWIRWHWMVILLPTELIVGLFVMVIAIAIFRLVFEDD